MIKNKLKEENLFYVMCYACCIFLFAVGWTKIQKLSFITDVGVKYGKCIPVVLSIPFLIKNLRIDKKSYAILLCLFLLFLLNFVFHDLSYPVFFIFYFMVLLRRIEPSRVYKYYSLSVFAVIVITLLLISFGVLENDNSYYGRYDLGFTYCTFGPNLFLSACIAHVSWRKEKTSLAEWCFILLLNQFFFWKTNTDAVYMCVLALFVGWLCIKNSSIKDYLRQSGIIRVIVSHSAIIFAVFTILFQIYFNYHSTNASMEWLNRRLSGRLDMGLMIFKNYSSDLSIFKELLFGLNKNLASYIDSSYIGILTHYGIPLLLLLCYLIDNLVKYSYDNEDYCLAFCIVVFMAHCITDPQLISFRANPLIVTTMFCFWKKERHTELVGSKCMKILFVSTDFNRSGAALAMIELAEKVRELGNEVLLLYPGSGDAVTEAQKRGLPYRIIRSYEWVKPLSRKEKPLEKLKWILKHVYNFVSIARIKHLIRKENVDIVHNNTLWGYVGSVAARLTQTPYVWHMRELLEEQQKKQFRWKNYSEKLIGKADALIAISMLVENKYRERFPEDKIHLIYDGVDVDKMYRKNHPLFMCDTIKIMIAGGVRPAKRQIDVVRAVEILNKKGISIQLSIVGADNTAYADSIKDYIASHGLEKCITFCGETADVSSYWENNDISVTASEYEAFGRVTAEAMLAGCVVVVSNSGANEEIVTDGMTGYVYELGSPESLATAIERILEDRSKAEEAAATGRESVKQRFSSEKNAAQVVYLYKTVLERRQQLECLRKGSDGTITAL